MVLAENTTTGAVSTGHKVKETESRSRNPEGIGHRERSQESESRIQEKSKKGTSTQETALQFVIPAKSADGGREPGSRKNLTILNTHWIPDLAPRSGARPE